MPRVPGVRTCEARHSSERGPRRRAFDDRAPRQGVRVGEEALREAPETHPETDVRGGRPGVDREQDHRARQHLGDAQKRTGEVLRRRYHAETETPRKTKRGEEAYETGGQGGNPTGSLPRGPGDGRLAPGLLHGDEMTQSRQTRERGAPADLQGKVKVFFRELGIVVGAFLILNSFVLASFEVPTGSMENEIMTGDFLLVKKFVFGGAAPRTLPFTNIRLPAFKLPSLWDVERGDIIVFIFPGFREEVRARDFAYYLKRAVAVAGATLEIRNRSE